jgi:hypothetical protein
MNYKLNKKTMETILVFKVSELHLHSKFNISQSWMHPSITATKWTIDSNQSDVLIKARHSIIAYIAALLTNLMAI